MTASLSMYDLANLREQIMALVAEQDGELSPDLETAWDAIDERFETKAENTALYSRELRSSADAVKAEAKRLAERAKALEVKAERLESLLLGSMQRFGKEKVNGLLCTIALQKNPPSVIAVVPLDDTELREIAAFARRYVRHTETWALDKASVLQDYKAGTLPAELLKRVRVEQGVSLRIR